MSEVLITEATENDITGIQRVADASWRATYKDIFTPEFINDFLAHSYGSESLRRSITNSADIFLVAREDGVIIGFCHCGGDAMQLYRIYLTPDRWDRGIGGKLIGELEMRLGERDIPSYHCYVHNRNERARTFYQRYGFAHVPERDQQDEDEWYMEKQLRPDVDLLDGR